MQNQVIESRNLVRAAASDGASLHQLHPRGCEIASAKHAIGHRLERFTEDVTARMPLQEEVQALRLSPGVPVFVLVRTAFDTEGTPVEVCDTVMAADQYVLSYELPAR